MSGKCDHYPKESPRTQEEIFALPVGERWLLYAPLLNVAALCNRTAITHLRRADITFNSSHLDELRSALTAQPPYLPSPSDGEPTPQFLGIIPTRACQLSCAYCGFGARTASQQRMPLRLAAAAVDWMADYMQHLARTTLEIHFFGGEPMAAPDVVVVAVHRARAVAAARGLEPRFEIATNGVFNEELASFVGDYFTTVVLSFDGPQSVHDRHRRSVKGRGSFTTVARTARQLSESPVELCFRTCVTQDTVARLEEITAWFCENFQPSQITFETLQPTLESATAGLQPPDPYQFAHHYFHAHRVAADYGVECIYAASLVGTPRLSFCPVGHDTFIVSPDGRISGCYLLESDWQAKKLDLHLGRLTAQGECWIDSAAIARLRRLVVDKPRCERCFCRWSCAGGCHVHHSYPSAPLSYNDFCVQTRLITACELLGSLAQEDAATQLIRDRSVMETLARQPSDCLRDWGN